MYFITFSEKMGSKGTEVARRVAEQLGYHFYDTEAIQNAAQETGFLKDIKEIDEKPPPLFQRLFSNKPEIHLDRLNSVIYELASKGNAVFLGRGSYILLREFKCALHIRVTASLENRIRNLVAGGIDREAAIRAIHKSDHERDAFVKFAFKVDWEDLDLYDLVLNMDHLTVELASDIVLHTARSEEIKARSIDAIKSLEMMSLMRRAEAALMEAGLSSISPSVSISEPGKIQLSGVVSEQSNKIKAEKILMGIKGIHSVDNQIKVVLHYSGNV